MAKIEWHYDKDNHDTDCIVVTKSKGKLNNKEVYELLERESLGMLIHLVEFPEEAPLELYDEGDTWLLYQPYDIIRQLIQYSDYCFNGDYEATEVFVKQYREQLKRKGVIMN